TFMISSLILTQVRPPSFLSGWSGLSQDGSLSYLIVRSAPAIRRTSFRRKLQDRDCATPGHCHDCRGWLALAHEAIRHCANGFSAACVHGMNARITSPLKCESSAWVALFRAWARHFCDLLTIWRGQNNNGSFLPPGTPVSALCRNGDV